ncbi:hemoglobin/transferrin/lactoferrin receptor protein [Rhodovulum sulfidophilum]|uniref:TonB-dependent receptor plug domain-containing protein n=2 Tax=Rhodovulum sulfidophilum TaxID=35806 RepID=UPI0009BD8EAA|nr:TonB-dependent receptor plug domain-containing protein [Rhodovulum sulfidophilum]MCW2303104.1 hemoglobin/transferrin/lactoferrin receptor protein [Rhodovulum sulfidophilum]
MTVRHMTVGLLACGTAIGLAWPATAQESFSLDPVMLGQSKREVRTDTAISETVVDEDEIEDRQATTIAELVDSVPGVSLINGNTPQGSGINIRGFGANSTNGSDQKVAIQVDGASVGSEELYRIGTQLFTDPALYKQVTVIRGTAGTFEYGSGIIGGLIRLDTKDASDFTSGEPGFKLRQTLQYGTNGDAWASSTIFAWQPDENLEFLGNYTYRSQGVQKDGGGNGIGSDGFDLPSWMLKGKYTFGEAREHYVKLSYSDTSSDQKDVPYDTFGAVGDSFGNVDRKMRSKTAVMEYGFNPAGNDLINLTATLSYAEQKIDQDYVPGSSSCETTFCGIPFPPGGFAATNADHRYETTKLTVKNQALFATGQLGHDLRLGVEYIRKERLDAASAPGGTDKRWALFAVDDMSFGGLTLTPALRYETQDIGGDSYADYDNDALMGGLSARYAFGNGWAVFGSAAYTENLPIIDDLGTPAYMTRSEKARTYELGFSYDRGTVFADGDDLALKLTAYHTTVWDITSYTTDMMVPITDARMKGLELEAAYSLPSGHYVDLNADIARGEITTPGVPDDWEGTPADQIRVTLGRKWGETLDLSWEVAHAAEMNRSAKPSGSNTVHNLRATWRPQDGVFKGTEIRAGIENAFDLDYTPHLATRPAPGRTLKLTLARTF